MLIHTLLMSMARNIFLENLQRATYSIYDGDEEALMQIWVQFNEYVCGTTSI